MRLFCGHAESPWMPRLRFVLKCLALATLLAAVLMLTLEYIAPWEIPKETAIR